MTYLTLVFKRPHPRGLLGVVLGALGFLLAMSALLSSEPASASGGAGAIAYVRSTTGDEIRLIDPDGSGDRRLWAHGLPDPNNVHAIRSLAWRPDGAELAFDSTHENGCSINHADIFVIGASGSGYRRITEAPACAALASYPKGTIEIPVRNSSIFGDSFAGFIYFQGAPEAKQVSLAPGASTVVTFHNVADLGPDPQVATMIEGANREISFATAADVQAGGTVRTGEMNVYSPATPWETHSPTWRSSGDRIGYVLNFNSTRALSPNPSPLDFGEELQNDQSAMPDFVDLLAWGPASRANQILYAGNIAFDSEAVYLMNEGSTTAGEKLVSYETYEDILGLAWLPDGSGFIYSVVEVTYSPEYYFSANLFEYRFATRQATRLTSFDGEFAGQLALSPDGQQIVFERAAERDELSGDLIEPDLYLMNRGGSGLRLLVADGSAPAWSPSQTQTPPATPTATVPPTRTPGGPVLPPKLYLPLLRR